MFVRPAGKGGISRFAKSRQKKGNAKGGKEKGRDSLKTGRSERIACGRIETCVRGSTGKIMSN